MTPPQPAGSWTPITAVGTSSSSSPQLTAGVVPWVVDPSRPCLLYQASDAQTIQRSSDSGATWTTTFHDTQKMTPPGGDPSCSFTCLASGPPFTLSSITFAGPASPLLTEIQNGDGVVLGHNQGQSWELRDDGLQGSAVLRAVVAPSDGNVIYAMTGAVTEGTVTESTAPLSLFVTVDQGRHWDLAGPLPGRSEGDRLSSRGLVVDPQDPSRLWVVGSSSSTSAADAADCADGQFIVIAICGGVRSALYETDDGGRHWRRVGDLPSGRPEQLTVIRSPRHPLRFAVDGVWTGIASRVLLSDDGVSWTVPPWLGSVDLGNDVVLAVSPRDNDHVILVAHRDFSNYAPWNAGPQVVVSTDGLNTVSQGPRPPVGTGFNGNWPFAISDNDLIEPALDGDFYVTLVTNCSNLQAPYCVAHQPPGYSGGAAFSVFSLWRFTPPAPGPSSAGSASQGVFASSSGVVATPATPLKPCNVPPPTSSSGAQSPGSSSVAFDGYDLLYTLGTEAGPGPQDSKGNSTVGVIHALDPLTCLPRPDIVVRFDAADLATWGAANGEPYAAATPPVTGISPAVDEMTYDTTRNVIWASIRNANHTGGGDPYLSGLFTIRVRPGTRLADAHLATLDGCGYWLAYDQVRDTLWTCHGKGMTAQLRASDAAYVPSCADTMTNSPGDPSSSSLAAWTFAGRDAIYTYNEDDFTMEANDAQTCTLRAAYTHRLIAEPVLEDEGMACDPLTFGPDTALPLPPAQRSVVLWMRDSSASTGQTSPYAIPNGWCPLPTAAWYSGAHVVPQGAALLLCGGVQQVYPSGTLPLANMPLRFTLNGPTAVSVPQPATTSGSGAAGCVSWKADVPAGQYSITVRYDPTAVNRGAQYLPSRALDTLVVIGASGAGVPGTIGTAVPPLPPAEPPAPPAQPGSASQAATGPAAQAQAQAQAEAQAQVQSQSQAQAQAVGQVQPGMMTQRAKRTQVARQELTGQTPTTYQASARQWARPQPAAGTIAGLMLLGMGFIARRPRPATARSRRRVRDP